MNDSLRIPIESQAMLGTVANMRSRQYLLLIQTLITRIRFWDLQIKSEELLDNEIVPRLSHCQTWPCTRLTHLISSVNNNDVVNNSVSVNYFNFDLNLIVDASLVLKYIIISPQTHIWEYCFHFYFNQYG